MSKICPVCNKEWPDEFRQCPIDGATLVSTAPQGLNLRFGDANAVSGGVNINQSRNSNDVHYHTVERRKSQAEILQDNRNRYYSEVQRLCRNGVVTVEARVELESLRFQLGFDAKEATDIENAVRSEQQVKSKASNDGLSIIGKMALKGAVEAVKANSPAADRNIAKLAPICKTTMNEQVHFYYTLLLAAFEPEQCVEVYECRSVDSYWLSFWASLAYKKLGDGLRADSVQQEMMALWQERPEINVLVNACIGILMDFGGDLQGCREQIIEYLTQSDEEPSEEIRDLFNALLCHVGVLEDTMPEYAFYEDNFFAKNTAAAEQPAAQTQCPSDDDLLAEASSAFKREDYATAYDIYSELAQKENPVALENLGYMCSNEDMGFYDLAKAEKYYRLAVEVGAEHAMNSFGLWLMGRGRNEEAKAFLVQSARDGHCGSMYALGSWDSFIPEPEREKWLMKAIENGHVVAAGPLSRILLRRRDERSHVRAFEVLSSAYPVINSDVIDDALVGFGLCYLNGYGVKKDTRRAVELISDSCDNGSIWGTLEMAKLQIEGRFVPKDIEAAKENLSYANDCGEPEAAELLRSLEGPTANIEKVTYDNPVKDDTVVLHIKFSVHKLLNQKVRIHLTLTPSNRGKTFSDYFIETASYEDCLWNDYQFLVPTNQLTLTGNEYSYGLRVEVIEESTQNVLAKYEGAIKAKEDTSRRVTFSAITQDHNCIQYEECGIRIHIRDLCVRNMAHCSGSVNAYFYYEDGQPLRDANNRFCTQNGQVATTDILIAPPDNYATIDDYILFLPYRELHLPRGRQFRLYFIVSFYADGDPKAIGESDACYFTASF